MGKKSSFSQDKTKSIQPQTTTTISVKKDVVKSSAAIHSSNSISLLERKVWNCLLANAYDKLINSEVHKISIKELADLLNYSSNNYDYLKETLERLISTVVSWNILSKQKEEWSATSLLASATIKDRTIYYSYSPFLREKLYNPTMYARINFSLQNKFSSKYALALYELCADYYDAKRLQGETPYIPLDKFRELMGVNRNEYVEFKRLSKRVIYDPIEEITSLSDFTIQPLFKREGRKIEALKFIIKTKEIIKSHNITKILPAPLLQKNDVTIELFQPNSLDNSELLDSRFYMLDEEERKEIERKAIESMPIFSQNYLKSNNSKDMNAKKALEPTYYKKVNELIENYYSDKAEN